MPARPPVPRQPPAAFSHLTVGAAAVLLLACSAQIAPGHLGVDELQLLGTEAIDPEAVKPCLATRSRPRFGFVLGDPISTDCAISGGPASRVALALWPWPWTPYPRFDGETLDRDIDRVERYYRARGYYSARVHQTLTLERTSDHTVSVRLRIAEGLPVRTAHVQLAGTAHLPPEFDLHLRQQLRILQGHRFDEDVYNIDKAELQRTLQQAGYAHARVSGSVQVDLDHRTAAVRYAIQTGPLCKFGKVSVTGYEDLQPKPIWNAAGIQPGMPYSLARLEEARSAVYALGPFAAVEVEPRLIDGDPTVDVLVRVVPGRRARLSLGVGMEVGGNFSHNDPGAGDSFAQWDVHLLSRIEHHNFLGGLRHLQIEERPRLIFDDAFPNTTHPQLGNALTFDLKQPGAFEARTAARATVRWDVGPDPFGGRFYRSELTAGVGLERRFWTDRMRISSSLNVDLFKQLRGLTSGPIPDYQAYYFQHTVALDLRDQPRRPKAGVYLAATFSHAGYFLPGDWDYLRVLPEARLYVPLPLGMVLAGRVLVGLLEVSSSQIETGGRDAGGFVDRLRRFGPLRHRLRGGGHNSVRGYRPNTLGDAVLIEGRLDSGGTRRWEASLEARVPLTSSLGTVLFVDAGDVSQEKRLRFNHPQLTFGFGLRYDTIVGPLRLDAGFAPPSLQVIGSDRRLRTGIPQARLFGLAPGTVHFTIGEAF